MPISPTVIVGTKRAAHDHSLAESNTVLLFILQIGGINKIGDFRSSRAMPLIFTE